MANLLWLQGGACSGNTMSFLNAEEPSACDLVTDFGINIPSLIFPAPGRYEFRLRMEGHLIAQKDFNVMQISTHQTA